MAKRYYEGKAIAERYLRYRIAYPEALFEFIVDYYDAGRGQTCNRELAVDVGCGNGQATLHVAEYFDAAIGCDISKEQIALAPGDNDRVEFRVSPAENLDFLEDNSVDLLTASAAFHYFDQQRFYEEAKRVLKPGGVLAVFTYGNPILDNKEGQQIFDEHQALVDKYLLEIKNLDRIYHEKELPFPEWKGIFDNDSFSARETRTIPEFIGTMSLSHAWEMYLAENDHHDYPELLRKRFAAAYKCEDFDQAVVQFTKKASLLIGRKPTNI